MNKNLIIALCAAFIMTGCKDLIEPAQVNNRQLDPDAYLPSDARFPFGVLLNGYTRIPTGSYNFSDVATDNAVSNDQNNAFLKMATGQWTAINNPLSQWTNSFAAIQYLNITLAEVDKVKWSSNEQKSVLFGSRIKGEAHGLRALYLYHLLLTHAGVGSDGKMLGVPLLLDPQNPSSDFNKPRATFDECLNQVYSDLNRAIELLPLDYERVSAASQIPAKFGTIPVEVYNDVFGDAFRGLLTARIAMGIRAQASLLAASPAYSAGNTTTWADAANNAAAVLNLKGGLGGFANDGLNWYANATQITGLRDGANPSEILWRNNASDNRDLEQANFPPTLFGNGRVNPTQNLVDAFPMANGYPITDAASGFNAADPYAGRDPRLKAFILVNGGTAGVGNTVINTAANSPTNDGLSKVETSTRTGYYMRKLLRQDVNLNPSSATNQRHYKPHIRYTEIFLAYAESANEAWGPTGTGANAYSAYDVIKAIRLRAGIGINGDPYLEDAKGSKEAMRSLIKNERRLELCFEGFRFWDLRRWKENLVEPANGVSINNGQFTKFKVQDRVYQPYMNYGPVPYGEILKFNALQQNQGW
ncbi:MAG: RagB/SusD family nutrient uptake outer membrane protein [Bacteroidota bacterium]